MKKMFNLAANLRVLFSTLRLFMALSTAVFVVLFFAGVATQGKFTGMPLVFDDAFVKFPTGSVTMKSPASAPQDIQIERVSLKVKFNLFSADSELAAALRWSLFPRYCAVMIFSCFFFTLLRNLCARIEQGEVFHSANVRTARNIGWALVGYSVADFALRIWINYRLGTYLEQHASLAGITGSFQTEIRSASFVANSDLITGLLILLLAEAFRQGLALKEENELTV